MLSPAITAVFIAILAALSFGSGFALAEWRSASQIQRLNSNNALLSAANDKCAADIHSARKALDVLAVSTNRKVK